MADFYKLRAFYISKRKIFLFFQILYIIIFSFRFTCSQIHWTKVQMEDFFILRETILHAIVIQQKFLRFDTIISQNSKEQHLQQIFDKITNLNEFRFQLWLLARQNHIPDCEQIMCENLVQLVVDLSETKLCQSPHDWTDYIYFLIAGEVILLIALFTKVSYDYYIFKTAGYLPWPASRMPKLPCDWLCES